MIHKSFSLSLISGLASNGKHTETLWQCYSSTDLSELGSLSSPLSPPHECCTVEMPKISRIRHHVSVGRILIMIGMAKSKWSAELARFITQPSSEMATLAQKLSPSSLNEICSLGLLKLPHVVDGIELGIPIFFSRYEPKVPTSLEYL